MLRAVSPRLSEPSLEVGFVRRVSYRFAERFVMYHPASLRDLWLRFVVPMPGAFFSVHPSRIRRNNDDDNHRYSEASFIKELEAQGVGRPSTYASIIGTLRTRTYVNMQARRCVVGMLRLVRVHVRAYRRFVAAAGHFDLLSCRREDIQHSHGLRGRGSPFVSVCFLSLYS